MTVPSASNPPTADRPGPVRPAVPARRIPARLIPARLIPTGLIPARLIPAGLIPAGPGAGRRQRSGLGSRRPGGRAGLPAALAVFGAGFGALDLFWLFGPRPTGLPGLFAFPSATWGDGLLLPLQAFALAHLLGRLPGPPAPGPCAPGRLRPEHPAPDRPGPAIVTRWLPWLAALAGGLAGAAVVLGALLDPAPPVDWTLPRPHHFSPAGVWHGVFLVLASALFARLWVDLLDRLRRQVRHRNPGVGPTAPGAGWLSVAVCAAAGYAVLAAHDGSRAASTAADLSTLVALAVAAVVLFTAVGVALRRTVVAYLPALVRGLGVAFALAAVVLDTAPRSPH